jgi:hypothetical protein
MAGEALERPGHDDVLTVALCSTLEKTMACGQLRRVELT